MAKKGRRPLRGLDPWKLRTSLEALPLQALSALIGEEGRNEHGLLLQLEAALHYGLFSIRDYLRAVPTEALAAACQRLGLSADGPSEEQILGIEGVLRYQPLASPRLTEEDLPRNLADNLTRRERLLILELHTRVARRKSSSTRLTIGEIAGRLGYVDEELTVSLGALGRAASIFSENGLVSTPDLMTLRDPIPLDLLAVIQAQPGWTADEVLPDSTQHEPARDADAEREFLSWVLSRIDSRPTKVATFRLSELVNRLGRYRAHERLRATAVVDIADFLHRHGIEMTPDYRQVDRGPGIDTLVRLQRQEGLAGKAMPVSERSPSEDPVLEYALKLGMVMARADDDLDDKEVAELRKHACRRLATHSQQELDAIAAIIEGLQSERIDVAETAERVAEELSSAEKQQLLEYLFDVAVADGVFLPQEEALLRQLHHRLRFDVYHFERLIRLCQATARKRSLDDQPLVAYQARDSATPVRRPRAPQRLEATISEKSPQNVGEIAEPEGDRHAQRAARLFSLLTTQ